MSSKQKITTYLWFDDNAEEAMNFYVSIFKNSKILDVTRYGDAGPGPKGTVMCGTFQLEGQQFMALNGGPHFKFTEAISLFVDCETQEEVDDLWTKLTAGGGAPSQCGWLKDKFGLSWQIVPSILLKMMADKDAAKSKRHGSHASDEQDRHQQAEAGIRATLGGLMVTAELESRVAFGGGLKGTIQ